MPAARSRALPDRRPTFDFGGEIVWKPTPEYIERSHLKRFMDKHGMESFSQLMERPTGDVAWFTDEVIKYLDIQFQEPYSEVMDLSGGIQHPQWCVGGKLNIVYNCVDKWAEDPATRELGGGDLGGRRRG